MKNEKLLVSKSSVDSLREVLADAHADRASEYINGYGDGIAYTLKMLGLMEGSEKLMEELTCSPETALKWVEQEIHDYCTDGMLIGSEIEAVAALTCIRDELHRCTSRATRALKRERQEADKFIRLLIKGEDVNLCEWCHQPDKGGEKCKGCYLYEDSDEFPSKFTAFFGEPD